jgi:hypothetical protein
MGSKKPFLQGNWAKDSRENISMTYKEKLIAWNSTEKYRKELDFLYGLINPKQGELILDFGCGLLTAVNYFNSKMVTFFYGYDVEEYGEQEDYHLYDREIRRKYDTIYFMHSLANIKEPVKTLRALRTNLSDVGKIIIVTHNLECLDMNYNINPSFVTNYDIQSISKLITEAGYTIDQIGQFGEAKGIINERIFIIAK